MMAIQDGLELELIFATIKIIIKDRTERANGRNFILP